MTEGHWQADVWLPLRFNRISSHRKAPSVHCSLRWLCPLLSAVCRILSDWLEVKLGGGKWSEESEEQHDGTLQTLCVTNSLQEKEQRIHKVHISVKVRSDCCLYGWLQSNASKEIQICMLLGQWGSSGLRICNTYGFSTMLMQYVQWNAPC